MALNPNKYLPLLPREPLISNGDISPRWRLYLEQLQRILGNFEGLDWQIIDKTNARLKDLGDRDHAALTNIFNSEGIATENIAEQRHVSQSQIEKWDSVLSNSNAEVLHWFF